MRKTGHYQTLGTTEYFIPHALPPAHPSLALEGEMLTLYGEAMLALGRLNEMATRLPNIDRFIKAYVIKEALLSSSIEGINTTLMDMFTQQNQDTRPNKDTQVVMNYTKALSLAFTMLRKEGFPVTNRVLLKAHETLLQMGDGEKYSPGQFRKQSVRVGYLTPPPPSNVPDLMANLEQYINTDLTLPPLIKAGLAHVQFETIHPFLDGNGRIGRLLIVLMLADSHILTEPIIYLSYYFKKHHADYYKKLDAVRTHGDFESWIIFYLKAMKCSAIDAHKRAKDIEALEKELTDLIIHERKFTLPMRDLRFHALSVFFTFPILSTAELAKHLNVSYTTAQRIIKNFMKFGFVVKETEKKSKLYRFKSYLDILDREYELNDC